MKFLRNVSVLAVLAVIAGTSANAYTQAQAGTPKETPPASYSGDVFVDSRGCAYARVTLGNTVNWVPRLSADRKTVVCGLTPTANVGRVADRTPPPPPAPPPPTALAAPAAAATTASAAAPVIRSAATAAAPTTRAPAAPAAPVASNVVTRTLSVTCPSDASSARVRIGGSTVSIDCPAGQTQPVRYLVRHGNGETTRLIANPAPAPVRIVTATAPAVAVTAPAPAAVTSSRAATLAAAGVRAVPDHPLVSNSPRVRIGGVPPGGATNNFGNGYGVLTTSATTARAPATTAAPAVTYTRPVGGATDTFGTGYGFGPVGSTGRVDIPTGYRTAWDDDRLNPNRGPQTATGDAQMAALYDTESMPMRERTPETTGVVVSTKTPAAPVAAAVAAPAAAPSGHRYVQVGMFNVPDNAQRAANKLAGLGLPGRIAKTRSGRTVVVAGPYASAADLRNALAIARRGGFSDAYTRN